jgi:hypothetical protein
MKERTVLNKSHITRDARICGLCRRLMKERMVLNKSHIKRDAYAAG